jgi:hypothetical protein
MTRYLHHDEPAQALRAGAVVRGFYGRSRGLPSYRGALGGLEPRCATKRQPLRGQEGGVVWKTGQQTSVT